jgi:hypothetical protein
LRGSTLIAHRCVLVAGMAMAAAAPAAAQHAAPPSIQLTLPPSQERLRAALHSAAEEAASVAAQWLGPHPTGTITSIAIDLPVWQGTAAMVAERRAAHAVIRSWWPADLPDHRARALLDGFAWYLQGHAVERLFDRRYLRGAHSVQSLPLFGGAVRWSVPSLRLSRWSAGILRHDRQDGSASRYAAMFATLERWMGTPALQAAMFEVARVPADRLTAGAIVETFGTVTGHDLDWLFTAVADSSVTFDYAVTELTSEQADCGSPCFATTVTARRLANGQFTGRTAAPIGSFQSGDAIALRVGFDDGSAVSARWDGRDETHIFRFQGPSRAVSAHLDPERIVMLDENFLNNHIVPEAPTNAPLAKWMARWMLWMQNAALSYGFFA